MATITLTIPDAVLPRVVDALCSYGDRAEDAAVAKGAFAKGVLIEWVTGVTFAYETRLAAEAARVAADAKARAEVTIT
jgi:hypothetical protein